MENKRILYFDDDTFTAQILARTLESYCWNIIVVSTIDDLFQELRDNRYDALIMDIMAPTSCLNHTLLTRNDIRNMEKGMNTGVVLTKKIWETEKNYKYIPVLFYSAKRIENIPNEGRKCYYLPKPNLAKNISDKLYQLLN